MAKKHAGKKPAGRQTGPKRSDAVRRKHLAEMAKSLADGRSPTEVVEAAASAYGISTRCAWDDYAEIRRQWAEQAAGERADVAGAFGLAVLRRGQLYRAALQNGDVHLALSVEQDRCKLLGLYPAEKSEVKTTTTLEIVEEIVCAEDGAAAPGAG